MGTFLELVNDVGRESGTMGGQSLASVTTATGRWLKLVAWTRQAWQMIQRERSDWTFRRASFEAVLTVGQARYTPVDLGITDFASWEVEADGINPFSIYDSSIGRLDESHIRRLGYRDWAERYDFGTHDANRPQVMTIDFDRKLCLGPKPDKAYRLRGWYRRGLQNLVADSDTPFIDPDFHQIIVWRALMLLGEDDESQFEAATSSAQYLTMRSSLIREYTEAIEL